MWKTKTLISRVRTGLKSTWIYRTVLKSHWKLNLPWKVLEKHSKILKSPWILPFIEGFNTVFGDPNQYKHLCLYFVDAQTGLKLRCAHMSTCICWTPAIPYIWLLNQYMSLLCGFHFFTIIANLINCVTSRFLEMFWDKSPKRNEWSSFSLDNSNKLYMLWLFLMTKSIFMTWSCHYRKPKTDLFTRQFPLSKAAGNTMACQSPLEQD